MNYKTNVTWDSSLVELYFVGSDAKTRGAGIAELCWSAIKITTGAPANTAGKFIPGAFVHNAISGITYENLGSIASPNFQAISTGGSGITALTGDVTASGSGSVAATIAALAVTTAKINNLAVTTGKIAAGAVDGTKIGIASQATGDIIYFNGTSWIRLAIGTAGQVLTVNGGATAPVWA